jgi:hypothetical protein
MDLKPPNAEEIAQLVEARLAAETNGETVSVEWRGGRKVLPVISMPIGLTYYNPATRRIRAQKDVDPQGAANLERDPFSAEAQSYLEDLLKWDPAVPGRIDNAFTKLQEDLKNGQNEPGLMTRDGVLINGNTRRAALKGISGRDHILVGILPADTGSDDIDTIELSLQLRRTHKRDYSFVNELIAIREQVEKATDEAVILRIFRMQKKRLQRSLWLLDFIDDAVDRSRVSDHEGNEIAIRRFDFERDQGQLQELYPRWHKLENSDPNQAALLREAWLAGIVLDFAKTDLRNVQPDFTTKYYTPARGAENLPAAEPDDTSTIPGMPDVVLEGKSPELLLARAITTQLLQARAQEIASTPDNPIAPETAKVLGKSREAYAEAAKRSGADESLRKKSLTPSGRLLEASDLVDLATSALAESIAASAVDVEALDGALESLQDALTRLASLASRFETDEAASSGIAWILASANLGKADDSYDDDIPNDLIIVD